MRLEVKSGKWDHEGIGRDESREWDLIKTHCVNA